MNDKALLLQIADKDEMAFQLFYKKYSHLIINRLKKIMGNDDKVFDVAQNIWMEAWNHPGKIKTNHEGNAIGFLVTYTTYQAYGYFREVKKMTSPLLISEVKEQTCTNLQYEHVVEEIQIKELDEQINSFLDTQPALSKQIFNLCKRQGLSITEVAEQVSSTNASVSVRLSNTVKQLKQHLVAINGENMAELILLTLIIFKNSL